MSSTTWPMNFEILTWMVHVDVGIARYTTVVILYCICFLSLNFAFAFAANGSSSSQSEYFVDIVNMTSKSDQCPLGEC